MYEAAHRQEVETFMPIVGYVEMLVRYFEQEVLLPDKFDMPTLARLCAEFRGASCVVDQVAKALDRRAA